MAYNWEIDENINGSKSWIEYYYRLGPICWRPESTLTRIIHVVLFVPWALLWFYGLIPSIIVLGVIGGTYNYIVHKEFLP